ncbi:hypothetical protein BOTNAR_0135g00020 [Botryotinia narcissicola]|uniref:Uncharacterized protein n=1 Tax=Botryotinia narcissicola TaxID=278944 RepID=A0A4Z1II07_9HELO|nr:hypothetical protein BOTNAR_0135g00020 [Botryotinia narcissicola]
MAAYPLPLCVVTIPSSHLKIRKVYQGTSGAQHEPTLINTLEMPAVMNRDISLFQLDDDAIAVRLLYASKINPPLPTSTPCSEIQFKSGAPILKTINTKK